MKMVMLSFWVLALLAGVVVARQHTLTQVILVDYSMHQTTAGIIAIAPIDQIWRTFVRFDRAGSTLPYAYLLRLDISRYTGAVFSGIINNVV